jgi:hypothetical protein
MLRPTSRFRLFGITKRMLDRAAKDLEQEMAAMGMAKGTEERLTKDNSEFRLDGASEPQP